MENKLENSFASDIYNVAPCYFLSLSHEGIVTRINLTFLSALGYTADEVINTKKFTELLTVGSKIFYQTHFYPLIKLHGTFNEIFLSFRTKSDEDLPVLLNARQIGSDDVFEIHCGGIQIAQRNRFEKEILEAKKVAEKALLENEALVTLKTELEYHQELLEERLRKLTQTTANQRQINMLLSHDLQEPIRKIALFSNKLLADPALVIHLDSLTLIHKINKASIAMRELVVSIQQYLSLDETQLQLSEFKIDEAVQLAIDKRVIDRSNAAIKIDLPSLPVIKGDFTLITNLFDHLLSNSLKFRDNSKVTLEIGLSADVVEQNIFIELEHKYKYKEFLRLTYTDNGIGFDNTLENEMFVLFRKAHDIQEGLGIGLSYCKKIVELHHGFISAKSDIGKGATFIILLPA